MDWIGFWNRSSTIYVSERHRAVHYASVADGIAALVSDPSGHVLDYGCGEALRAERVRARCARLFLCDAAENVRRGLVARLASHDGIEVLAPGDLARLRDRSLHLIVVNSVVQYLDEAALGSALAPGGRIVFADIVPPDASPLYDARALLSYAARNGFLLPAVTGLVRTAFSDYPRLRARLGLAKYSEPEFLALLDRHGLEGTRIWPNIGHNQGRMAFAATPAHQA